MKKHCFYLTVFSTRFDMGLYNAPRSIWKKCVRILLRLGGIGLAFTNAAVAQTNIHLQ